MYGFEQMISDIKIFTMLGGSALVAGEVAVQYIKYKKNKVEKLAKSKIENIKNINSKLGDDGLIINNEVQLKGDYDFEGSIILGPTGAGKSTNFFFTNLLQNNIRGSIVVFDVKGELYNKTSYYQKHVCGRKVYKLSPLDPIHSERFNLLENCKTAQEVIELAGCLLMNGSLYFRMQGGSRGGSDDVVWLNMAKPLLAAAMFFAKEQEAPYNTIEYAIEILLKLDFRTLEAIFNSKQYIGNINLHRQWDIFKMARKADATEASIKITMASNMQIFADDNINMIDQRTTFNFDKFREEESIIYITYPPHKAAYLAPYMSAITSKMFNTFLEGNHDFPIHIFADEMANIGLLPNISNLVSTIRSARISFNAGLQSITQLQQIYGNENTSAILNNLKTKIVLPGLSDIPTLEYISKLCGSKEITVKSMSQNDKNQSSENISKTKISLFDDCDLRCLQDGEMLLITSNKYPLLLQQSPYYKYQKYNMNVHAPLKSNVFYSNKSGNISKIIEDIKEEYKPKKKLTKPSSASEKLKDLLD